MENLSKACLNSAIVCRFCLSQSGIMSSLFNDNYNNNLPSLPSKIMSFVGIQLYADDGLPSVLCHRCLYNAEKAYDFKAQCEASDAMLREYVSAVQAYNHATPKPDPQILPTPPTTAPPHKRKRGRPRKEENLIFYSSPEHPEPELTNETPDEVKMVDGIESVVTVVDPTSNSDDESKKEEFTPEMRRDINTARSLAIARAKAKKYMGVVFAADDQGVKIRRHLCKGCGKTFGHCSDLRKHVLVHTGERPFHCQLCPKTFSRSTNLNKHLKVHSGQKPFGCTDCPKSFTSKGDLQRHLVIHTGVKPFSCSQCQQSFSRKDKLTRHVKLHYPVDDSVTNFTGHVLGLEESNEEFENPPETEGYEATGEDDMRGMSDNDVKEEYESSSDVAGQGDETEDNGDVESMVINIDPFPVQSDGGTERNGSIPEDLKDASPDHWTVEESGLQCVFCQRICPDEGKMRIHLSNHMLGRPHKCQLCDKAFTRRRELLRHENVHTGLKPHKCPVCSRAFARKDKLSRHVRIHTYEKPAKKISCEICAVGFYKMDLYEAHMATHPGAVFNSSFEQNSGDSDMGASDEEKSCSSLNTGGYSEGAERS